MNLAQFNEWLKTVDLIDVDYANDNSIYEKAGKYYRIQFDDCGYPKMKTFVEVIPVPVLTYVYMSEKEIEEEEKKKKLH